MVRQRAIQQHELNCYVSVFMARSARKASVTIIASTCGFACRCFYPLPFSIATLSHRRPRILLALKPLTRIQECVRCFEMPALAGTVRCTGCRWRLCLRRHTELIQHPSTVSTLARSPLAVRLLPPALQFGSSANPFMLPHRVPPRLSPVSVRPVKSKPGAP
jgi:hypothetical protein